MKAIRANGATKDVARVTGDDFNARLIDDTRIYSPAFTRLSSGFAAVWQLFPAAIAAVIKAAIAMPESDDSYCDSWGSLRPWRSGPTASFECTIYMLACQREINVKYRGFFMKVM